MKNLALALLLLLACKSSSIGGGPPGPGDSTGGTGGEVGGAGGGAGGGASPDAATLASDAATMPVLDGPADLTGGDQGADGAPDGRAGQDSSAGGAPDGGAGQDSSAGDAAALPAGRAGVYVASLEAKIHALQLDLVTGALTYLGSVPAERPTGSLAIHPNRRYLYAPSNDGQLHAGIDTYAISATDGSLTRLGFQSTSGNTYAWVHRSGKWLFLGGYQDFIDVRPIGGDGRPGDDVYKQFAAQATTIADDGVSGRFLFATSDRQRDLMQFVFDEATGQLTPNKPATVPPSTARVVFHPPTGSAFRQYGDRITSDHYDTGTGLLTQVGGTNLPTGSLDGNAYLAVHPSKPLLYITANRGLAIFAIESNGQLGKMLLDPNTHQLEIGKQLQERQFAIDPSGQFLVAPGGYSSFVRAYRLDAAGMPGQKTEIAVGGPNVRAAITLVP
jgi:6-phosphogluconolactonase